MLDQYCKFTRHTETRKQSIDRHLFSSNICAASIELSKQYIRPSDNLHHSSLYITLSAISINNIHVYNHQCVSHLKCITENLCNKSYLTFPLPYIFVGVLTEIKMRSASCMPLSTSVEKKRFFPRAAVTISSKPG